MQLSAGDVIVFSSWRYPRAVEPQRHAPEAKSADVSATRRRPHAGHYLDGQRDGHQRSLCLRVPGCDVRPFNPLLAALPRVIRVSDDASGTLSSYVRFALTESQQPRIGGESVLSRLSELMFLHVVRRYLETLPADKGRLAFRASRRAGGSGARCAPPHSLARLDSPVACSCGGNFPLRAGGALHEVRWPSANRIPHELANAARCKSAAHEHGKRRRGSERSRLRV